MLNVNFSKGLLQVIILTFLIENAYSLKHNDLLYLFVYTFVEQLCKVYPYHLHT